MKTIWKFELSPDNMVLKMPKRAKVLSVQTQLGKPCIWALVDTENGFEERTFEIFGTGHEIPDDGAERIFLDTFQLHNGMFVFHAFEKVVK
jgi:hypothetical protein